MRYEPQCNSIGPSSRLYPFFLSEASNFRDDPESLGPSQYDSSTLRRTYS